MLKTFGTKEVIKNVYRIVSARTNPTNIKTTDDLRSYFLDFLAEYHPKIPVNRNTDPFITDLQIENRLSEAHAQDSLLNDLSQQSIIGEPYSDKVRLEKICLAKEALEELKQRDENFKHIFELTVHSIFIRRANTINGGSAYGGSTSGSIGVIWLSGADVLSKEDYMEIFVHELTHQLVFIDELNHPQFDYPEMFKKENFADSAILYKKRPLDKVIHSVVVATEVVIARQEYLPKSEKLVVHPHTENMLANIKNSYKKVYALKNLDRVIKKRTHELLEQCIKKCDTYANQELVLN